MHEGNLAEKRKRYFRGRVVESGDCTRPKIKNTGGCTKRRNLEGKVRPPGKEFCMKAGASRMVDDSESMATKSEAKRKEGPWGSSHGVTRGDASLGGSAATVPYSVATYRLWTTTTTTTAEGAGTEW